MDRERANNVAGFRASEDAEYRLLKEKHDGARQFLAGAASASEGRWLDDLSRKAQARWRQVYDAERASLFLAPEEEKS